LVNHDSHPPYLFEQKPFIIRGNQGESEVFGMEGVEKSTPIDPMPMGASMKKG
jgi:hypothetical protein